MESNRSGQGGTGSLEGFRETRVTQEPLVSFGQRKGSCGLHVQRIPPAVRLRSGEGHGQKQGDQVGSPTVIQVLWAGSLGPETQLESGWSRKAGPGGLPNELEVGCKSQRRVPEGPSISSLSRWKNSRWVWLHSDVAGLRCSLDILVEL